MMLLYSIVVLIGVSISDGANILAIIPLASYSHQVAHQQLWKELSLRGHKITVVTPNPMNDPFLTNLTEIDLSYLYEIKAKTDHVKLMENLHDNPLKFFLYMETLQNYILEEELSHPLIQKLIKKESKQEYDVIFVEFLFPAMYAFAEIYKCPLIAISSLEVTSNVYNSMGNLANPVTHPDQIFMQDLPPLNFKERITNTLFSLFQSVYVHYVSNPHHDVVIKKYFGSDLPSVRELKEGVSLLFLNVNPIYYTVRPLIPSIILVGGGSHITTTKALPKDLEHFIENSTEGIIYFSLGSNVNSGTIGKDSLIGIYEVFEELPYKVVWKFDSNSTNMSSDKLYQSKWLPQQSILANPKVKLFITQGGLQSLDEALYNHVPVLGIPIFADQAANIKSVVSRGIGLSLDHKTINKGSFKTAILELINNQKYRNNVIQLANLARDQPMTGLQSAVWWTEYVIRHKGAKHLRSPFVDLPNYQYYHIDIIAFCLLVLFLVAYIPVKMVRVLYNFVRSKSKTKEKVQ